jgi:predicted cupin superfamily sugar epimerase
LKGGRLTLTAQEIIQRLQLEPLAGEGGYFRETYRSKLAIPSNVLSELYDGDRQVATAMFYLLTPETFSAMHRLPGDEIFHFYVGDAVEMLQLHPNGTGDIIRIGSDIDAGMRPQVLVPGGSWQGSRLLPGGSFALMGTTMAPGFEFADYATGRRAELIAHYPNYRELITALTDVVSP